MSNTPELIAERKLKRAMGRFRDGELRGGRKGGLVSCRRQALAIALSEARRAENGVVAKPRKRQPRQLSLGV